MYPSTPCAYEFHVSSEFQQASNASRAVSLHCITGCRFDGPGVLSAFAVKPVRRRAALSSSDTHQPRGQIGTVSPGRPPRMEVHSVMLWTEHVHGNRHRREPACAVCNVVLRITAFGSASKFRTPSHFSRHFDRRRITQSRGPRGDLHAEATLSLQASLRDLSSVRQTYARYAQLTFSRLQAPIPTTTAAQQWRPRCPPSWQGAACSSAPARRPAPATRW